jgi:predicted outer membrane repeat protein
LALFAGSSCKRGGGAVSAGETMYVSAPQANLRDHVSTVYNRVGSVKNGDKVEVLERQKRFVRVRTTEKLEGWIELRALVPAATFDQFQKMAKDNRTALVQGKGWCRARVQPATS